MSSKPMPAMEVASRKSSVDTPDQPTASSGQRWYFCFFLVSGFCSILYELIWLRLAMAQFGVTTPMVSIVLSSFMGGLGVGSLAAGRLLRKYAYRLTIPPLHLYAATEIFIGCSAVIVPLELLAGRYLLEHLGQTLSLSSAPGDCSSRRRIAGRLPTGCATSVRATSV